jgi:hypothetical protein
MGNSRSDSLLLRASSPIAAGLPLLGTAERSCPGVGQRRGTRLSAAQRCGHRHGITPALKSIKEWRCWDRQNHPVAILTLNRLWWTPFRQIGQKGYVTRAATL